MPLKYPPEWKFDGFPHKMPVEAHREFVKLIGMMAEGAESRQDVYEAFKSGFGDDTVSSETSWAESDMSRAIGRAMDNAARYVTSYYAGVEYVKRLKIDVPAVTTLNRILTEHGVPLLIDPPNLILKEGDIEIVPENSSAEMLAAAFVRGPEIGRGGFGAVYKVIRKTKVGEYFYAMKVLEPSVFIQNQERAKIRFSREMQVLDKLQHRGIVPLLEAGLDAEQRPYILMPYIEGSDLRKALSGAGPQQVLTAFQEILLALEFAHSNNAVHRDLKPSNVIVRTADSQPLILDFGCAYLLDEVEDSVTTTLIGTPGYIPPEVHQNPKHRDVRQDVYACGVMLYQVIMGRLPRPDEYEPVEGIVEGFVGIDQVIQEALAPERRRTASAKAMREQLVSVF
jgi:predicted Ser/Thr protein kinase